MASKRDLVEAHAFNRRRLITAFVSGAPGGREAEPRRPARAVIVGVVLAGAVVGGAAVAGYLRPGLPNGWDQNTVVVARTSGARYLATGGVLYPVANTTSARLLLPAADGFRVVLAPDDRIALKPRGSNIGIIGAPDALPAPEALVQSGWTDCLDRAGRTRERIGRTPAATKAPARSGLLVQAGSDLVVLANGGRFRISATSQSSVLRAVGLDGVEPLKAPGSWVDLFPARADLAPLRVVDAGKPLPPGVPHPGGATRYGTLLQVTETNGVRRPYVLTASGLAPLSPLGAALYEATNGATLGPPLNVTQADVGNLPTADPVQPSDWPTDTFIPLDAPVACGILTTQPDQLPDVALGVPTTDEARPTGEREEFVEPGGGALVRAISAGVVNYGTVFLIDSSGTRYALGGGAAVVQAQLGYGRVRLAPVPEAWLEGLHDGPELSANAARQVVVPIGTGG